jgi:hypothetical protein
VKAAPLAALGSCLVLAAGCSANVQIGTPSKSPACPAAGGRVNDSLVAVAQSVPTAAWVPCLSTLPAGWTFHRLEVQSGRSRVTLTASDARGDHQVLVLLRPTCDVTGTSEQDSGQAGVRRYDRPAGTTPGYHADRYLVFPGGCITQHFDLQGPLSADAPATISAGLGLLSRSAIAAWVARRSHGRLDLDPAG